MLKILNKTIIKIKEYEPDRIVLIDYPGFNLRLAKKNKSFKYTNNLFYFTTNMGMGEKKDKVDERNS